MMNPVDQIESDIKNLHIQGATNVALAVLEALEKHPDKSIGERLAYARPTEHLAQNAVRYIFSGENITQRIEEYKNFIADAKQRIPEHGKNLLVDGGSYLTICHSQTTVDLFHKARAGGAEFSMYVAETRPLYQGRTTANDLLRLGFDDVTMVIDDVAVSLIEGRKGKIDAVFVGADLLTDTGFVNKIGTLAVIASANRKNIPAYSLSTLLKYDPRPYDSSVIETRSADEIWKDAPEGLKFYTPAFDFVPYYENVRMVTETGIIPGDQVPLAAKQAYPFIVESTK